MALRLLILALIVVNSTSLPSRRMATRKSLFRSKKKPFNRGTCFSFQPPTSGQASRWFVSSFAPAIGFNHDTAGMTNPSLHISVNQETAMHISTTKTTLMEQQTNSGSWWPRGSTLLDNASSNKKNKKWDVVVLTQSLGMGRACYHAVRDAALAWDFRTNRNGICTLDPPPPRPSLIRHDSSSHCGYHVVYTSVAQDDVFHARPSLAFALGASNQPLVTFQRILRGPFWVVNPVRVLYNLVDQRGPGTTYTSTAYATLQGHWLRGEERVTVVLRDNGHVEAQIVSYSKPHHLLLKLLPYYGRLQRDFLGSQLQHLQQVASDAMSQQDHQSDLSKTIPMPMEEPLYSLPMKF